MDFLAPPVHDRRKVADRVRKRIVDAVIRQNTLVEVSPRTLNRDSFLRWAALTYPGYRPPLDQMQPVICTGSGSLSFSGSGTGFVLPNLPDHLLRDVWINAEQRAADLEGRLATSEARIAELEGEISALREADRKRRETARANARRPRNL